MSTFSDRRKLSRRIPIRENTFPAQLGDGNGNLYYQGNKNLVYARIGGHVEVVFNNRVPAGDGIFVTVGRDQQDPELPGVFQVLSTRTETPGGSSAVGSVGGFAPAERYRWFGVNGGQDPLWVEQRQIMPLRVGPLAGMTINIYHGLIWTGSGFAYIADEIKDLTSYIPSTSGQAAFVLVTVNTSGVVVYTKGSEFTLVDMTTAALMLANISALPSGTAYAAAAVRVYAGQTAVVEGPANTDIVDLRGTGWAL